MAKPCISAPFHWNKHTRSSPESENKIRGKGKGQKRKKGLREGGLCHSGKAERGRTEARVLRRDVVRAEVELPVAEAEARGATENAVANGSPLRTGAVNGEVLGLREPLAVEEQDLGGVGGRHAHAALVLLHVGACSADAPVAVRDTGLARVGGEIALNGGFVRHAALPPGFERLLVLLADVAVGPVLEVRPTLTEHGEEVLEHPVVVREALVALHDPRDGRELRPEKDTLLAVREDDLGGAVLAVALGLARRHVRLEKRLDRGRRFELRPEVAEPAVLHLVGLRHPSDRRPVVGHAALALEELDAQGVDPAHLAVDEGDEGRRILGLAHPGRVFARPARIGNGRAGGRELLLSNHVKGRRHDDSAPGRRSIHASAGNPPLHFTLLETAFL